MYLWYADSYRLMDAGLCNTVPLPTDDADSRTIFVSNVTTY